MATHYTDKQKERAFAQLNIKPVDGRVTSTEAAKILTWRSQKEYGEKYIYNGNAVRKHKGKLDAQYLQRPDGTLNTRMHTYDVNRVFEIDIAPQRKNRGNPNGNIRGIDKVLTDDI